MWKRDEETPEKTEKQTEEREEGGRSTREREKERQTDPATIGPSITVNGDVTGDEDLFIHGRVEGSVDLGQQAVTIGSEGRVNADITGRVVIVEGEVHGDLKAEEQIILRSAARVQGDLTSPRVVLEDGASFEGLVDMSQSSDGEEAGGRRPSTRSRGASKAPTGTDDDASGSTSGSDDVDADPSAREDSKGTTGKAGG